MGGSGKWIKSIIGLKKSEKDDQVINYSHPFLSPISNLDWVFVIYVWFSELDCKSRWVVVVGMGRVGSGSYGGASRGQGVEATGRRPRLPIPPHWPMPSVPQWRHWSGRLRRISSWRGGSGPLSGYRLPSVDSWYDDCICV